MSTQASERFVSGEQPTCVLVKPASADCNLSCTYCFYHCRESDPYAGKGPHRMSEEVLDSLVRQHMRAGRHVAFSWQGGEPMLMGLKFYKRVTELQMKYGRAGQTVGNAVQTNATLIDEKWARFFRRFNVLVGASLDGPREVHDYYRKFKSGRGSWERVMRSVEVMKKCGAEFNALAVVTDRSMGMAEELYDFFLEHGILHVQFIPCVERDADGNIAPYSVTAEGYGEFLCRLFDKWYRDGDPILSERFFDNVVSAYVGIGGETCEFRERCGTYVVVEYNGDVYPCDFFVREDLLLGNILETPLSETATSEKAREFAARKAGPFAECEECEWLWLCRRGCHRLRGLTPDAEGHRHYLCEAYKKFWAYSADRFKKLRDMLIERGVVPR